MTGARIPVMISSVTPKGLRRREGEETIKTTVDLPHPLWRAAKVRAMDEKADLRAIIIKALEAYLKLRPKGEPR